LLATSVACGSATEGETWQLTITPVTPFDQTNLFDLGEEMRVVVEESTGQVSEWDLGAVGSGGQSSISEVPDLTDALLRLELLNSAGEQIGRGVTEAVTLTEGEANVTALVSQIDAPGTMADLADALSGGALVADGTGRFLLFGGSEDGLRGDQSATDQVFSLSITPPDDELAFSALGPMPPRQVKVPDGLARMGHSATRLTGAHDDQGKILVAGGSTDYQDCYNATEELFLWDPATDTAESFSGRGSVLPSPQYLHVAAENNSGGVVFAGGSAGCVGTGIVRSTSISMYDPVYRSVVAVAGTASGPLLGHAGARTPDGVLLCGGIDYATKTYEISAACDLVTDGGQLAAAEALPLPLMHLTLTPLEDGSVLAAGGLSATGDVADTELVPGSNRSFLFANGAWREVGEMEVSRGMHAAARLPDGRVLIIGGVTESDSFFWNGTAATSCLEIYDPATETFTALDGCAAGTGPLPGPTSLPMVAADDRLGVLIAGGMGESYRPLDYVQLFVGAED